MLYNIDRVITFNDSVFKATDIVDVTYYDTTTKENITVTGRISMIADASFILDTSEKYNNSKILIEQKKLLSIKLNTDTSQTVDLGTLTYRISSGTAPYNW